LPLLPVVLSTNVVERVLIGDKVVLVTSPSVDVMVEVDIMIGPVGVGGDGPVGVGGDGPVGVGGDTPVGVGGDGPVGVGIDGPVGVGGDGPVGVGVDGPVGVAGVGGLGDPVGVDGPGVVVLLPGGQFLISISVPVVQQHLPLGHCIFPDPFLAMA